MACLVRGWLAEQPARRYRPDRLLSGRGRGAPQEPRARLGRLSLRPDRRLAGGPGWVHRGAERRDTSEPEHRRDESGSAKGDAA